VFHDPLLFPVPAAFRRVHTTSAILELLKGDLPATATSDIGDRSDHGSPAWLLPAFMGVTGGLGFVLRRRTAMGRLPPMPLATERTSTYA